MRAGVGYVDHRPLFHVRPPTGWINDPNAPVEVDGEYHLFCQYNPRAAVHGDVHWAHFTSSDLIRWRLHPPALVPDRGGADADGCWSGSAVLVDGAAALLYSGFHLDRTHQNVCLAWPNPDGTWRKDAGNPVLEWVPDGLDVRVFRDPFVWREDDTYHMIIGAGLASGGAALRYRSADLRRWEYVGIFASAEGPAFAGVRTGDAWECPQLARWGADAILVLGAWYAADGPAHTAYVTGRLADGRLLASAAGRLDHGPDLYAAALTMDSRGRWLLWAWSWEARPDDAAAADGWAGVLTLPRVLRLGADGRPAVEPAAELTGLRGTERRWSDVAVPDATVLDPAAGDALEIVAALAPGAGGRTWLRLRASPDGAEYTEVGVDADRGEVYLDRERSSLDPSVAGGRYAIPIDPAERVPLRIYADRSIVELFVGDRHTITVRIYPTRPDSIGLGLGSSSTGAIATVSYWPIAVAAVRP